MARLKPLPPQTTPELKAHFDFFLGTLGFTPNSVLIMQRRPKLVQAFAQFASHPFIRVGTNAVRQHDGGFGFAGRFSQQAQKCGIATRRYLNGIPYHQLGRDLIGKAFFTRVVARLRWPGDRQQRQGGQHGTANREEQ